MKEVGEQLLNVMRTALEAKRGGKRGNYQGVLNNTRHIFDTTLRQASGAFPDLKPMIVEAQRIQTEGARINGPAKSAGGGSRSINLADAFDFQQKKRQAKNLNVAEEEAQPKKKQPTIQEQEYDTEIETVQVPDPDLISHLGAMTPAKLRDYFGGMDGARIFAQEMFQLEQGEDQNDTNFLSAVLRRINGLKKEANV